LNDTHQLLVYAVYINLLGERMCTVNKNKEVLQVTLGDWSRGKCNSMFMSCEQNARQYDNINIGNTSFERV
jgi:hypothetical protein